MTSLQKTNSCLLENNIKVLGNDEADVNNQMSQKYRGEHYALSEKITFFSGLDADIEGGIRSFYV